MIHTSHWYNMITGTGNGPIVVSSPFGNLRTLKNLYHLSKLVKDDFFCFHTSRSRPGETVRSRSVVVMQKKVNVLQVKVKLSERGMRFVAPIAQFASTNSLTGRYLFLNNL